VKKEDKKQQQQVEAADKKEKEDKKTNVTEDLVDALTPICLECKTAEHVIGDYTQGYMVCQNCAVVCGDRFISEGTEWRSFSDGPSNKSDPNRIGGPESSLMEHMGLSTVIGADMGSSEEGGNLARWQNRGSIKSSHRNLLTAFRKTGQLATRLSLPQTIVERSNELFKRVDESKELKGRRTESILTACLFIACRQAGVPRTLKELCAVSEVMRRDVGRCFSKIIKLKIYKKSNPGQSNRDKKSSDVKMQAPSGSKFMERFCSSLNLSTAVTRAAEAVSDKVAQLAIAEGKRPETIAGGAIYLVTQLHATEKRTYKDIAAVTQLAESTIRQSYKQLYERRTELVPPEYVKEDVIKNLQLN